MVTNLSLMYNSYKKEKICEGILNKYSGPSIFLVLGRKCLDMVRIEKSICCAFVCYVTQHNEDVVLLQLDSLAFI